MFVHESITNYTDRSILGKYLLASEDMYMGLSVSLFSDFLLPSEDVSAWQDYSMGPIRSLLGRMRSVVCVVFVGGINTQDGYGSTHRERMKEKRDV